MEKLGVITYTIEHADNHNAINSQLFNMFNEIDEIDGIDLFDTRGTHDTLYIIETDKNSIQCANIIYDKFLQLLRADNIFKDEQLKISILLSLNSRVYEIISDISNNETQYLLSLYCINNDSLLKQIII